MNIPDDILYEIFKYFNFAEFYSISSFIPKSCIIHYLNNTKVILSSTQQIDKLLELFDETVAHVSTATNKMHLEIMYTLSYQDLLKIRQLNGKYIKIHCIKGAGSLIDINESVDKFETREINFYKSYMNLPVVFNLLMNHHSKNTTILFHNCKRLYLDDMTIFYRRYSSDNDNNIDNNNNYNYYDNDYNYYNNDIYFLYIKESELNTYFKSHPFMHVLADNNHEITPNYIKIKQCR